MENETRLPAETRYLPQPIQINPKLAKLIQTKCTGANVHKGNGLLQVYYCRVHIFNASIGNERKGAKVELDKAVKNIWDFLKTLQMKNERIVAAFVD